MSPFSRSTLIVFIMSAVSWAQVATSQMSGVVQDPSGAAVADADVTATQIDTALVRTAKTGTDGAYVLPNLPVGPYRLSVTKSGFKAAVRSGIVLQVDSNPVLNFTMALGSVSETIVVEGSTSMVETHEGGIGQVIDHQSVVDLPLNGRQATDLIYLSGGATSAPAGDLNTNKNYPTQTISVGGGLPNAISYLMDGASNNDPFNNLNLPFPFPDALQEFKVETSAIPAQYGQHAAAAVNVVTKSGTNAFHGDVFEFFRNGVFNARDFFAPARDSLKRNQFGGTIGGPIQRDRLFFFLGYQGTIVKSDPPGTTANIPTPAMLSGDFTAFASAACQGSNKTLAAPFVGNKIAPGLLSTPALNFVKHLPVSQANACGLIQYGIVSDNTEHQVLGRIDYQWSAKHQLFGRYFFANYQNPVTADANNVLTANKTGVDDQSQSFVLGDNYSFLPNLIASFHATVNRTHAYRVVPEYFTPSDLGVAMHNALPGFMGINVASGFSLGTGGTNPGYFNSTAYQVSEDVNMVHGSHQFAFGVNYIRAIMNSLNNRPTNGQFTFSSTAGCAGCTGIAMADFMVGTVSGGFVQGGKVYDNDRSNLIGIYAQDSWKVSPRLSISAGVRWEPFLPESNRNGYVEHFDPALFASGARSPAYVNSPAGLTYPGDAGFPGNSNIFSKKGQFAPRVGVVWDPKGDGKMTLRASYGIFYDTPQLFFYTRFANNPPWGAQISLPLTTFANPWSAYQGGDPFPGLYTVNKNMPFPFGGVYVNMPLHTNPPNVQQWNFSFQRQFGGNLLLSANYFGNSTTHMWTAVEANPALPVAGATLGTENQHRVLYLQNAAQGQYYATIGQVDDGGKAGYHGMLITVQRRMANHFSALTNFTWSHCLSDPETTELTGPSYINPNSRKMDRANCSSDRRRILNLALIANSPGFGNRMVKSVVGGWQFSTLIRYQSGNFTTVVAGSDMNLSGIGNQRPNQIATDPILSQAAPGSQRFSVQYLNAITAAATSGITKGAFSTTGIGPGAFGTLGPLSILNPSMVKNANAGLEMRQKAPHCPRRVPGLPGLRIARAQQPGAFSAAGGGAVGQQQAHVGLARAQALNQDRRRAGFSKRHGMNPDVAAGRRSVAHVAAKALVHGHQITRLGHAALAQPGAHQGLGQPHQQRVNQQGQAVQEGHSRAGHAVFETTPSQACHTACTVGAGWANTLTCRALCCGPVRQAVSKL